MEGKHVDDELAKDKLSNDPLTIGRNKSATTVNCKEIFGLSRVGKHVDDQLAKDKMSDDPLTIGPNKSQEDCWTQSGRKTVCIQTSRPHNSHQGHAREERMASTAGKFMRGRAKDEGSDNTASWQHPSKAKSVPNTMI
ncbi:hypothetical protein PSHT_13831 [Puccinia striiformis]|uniref:Uncharacterized protein n=4 Tax=Puccinia striiformis TaxID=27350 RepID=A0A0L0W344_9BASI|nr:hypothetical protein H4Q26_009686 [Puccinia striiformis f. sp. tritici PST-130]KNF05705.1 hypothetical protein PSTG_01108 [Puccinia striiformis f. sp. tritici PST-78]POV94015.1 hypothetical protein PSTT_17071 [Puccinia striiformis]POV98848.1 hypothetical protein PSHT_13831 [Puccinia striiformis]POW02204.1 hypothetical protein PSTT_11901 [Puccinia striiformis]